ncbi:hypothetical protein [Nannocystis radixulma]|uniref:Uncharacterized protein n=1 Tax=Nannocystis radixulma TaxID=2995305 RepID=A0ABT5BP07_9BACT|nr:hypothetical protein [Nannocystis radixulma]MDC0675128.1 hypothetical protein [Nannocystis radixulma]
MLVIAPLLLAAVGPAAPPIDLTWQVPAGCPDPASVLEMVNGLLRRPPTAAEPERTVARASVTRVGPRWELRLELQTTRGEFRRTVQAESCQVLARATALVIAIHLDPLAVSRGLDPPAAVVPPPEPPPLPPAPPDLPDQTAPAPSGPAAPDLSEQPAALPPIGLSPGTATAPLLQPLGPLPPVAAAPPPVDMAEETAEFVALRPREPPADPPVPPLVAHLRVDGGFDYGVLPGIGGHAGLFAGVTLPRVRLEAGIIGVPLRILPAQDNIAGGRFDRVVGALRICPLLRPSPAVLLALCIGGEAGAIQGVGLQVAVPNPRWAPWLGLFLGPAVRWQIAGPVGLWFGVDGVLALGRPIFTVGAGQEVFQSGRAGVRATFGVDLQFGPRNR